MTTRNGISRRESLKLMFGMLFTPFLKWLPKEKKREKFDFKRELPGKVATTVGALEWPDKLQFVPMRPDDWDFFKYCATDFKLIFTPPPIGFLR